MIFNELRKTLRTKEYFQVKEIYFQLIAPSPPCQFLRLSCGPSSSPHLPQNFGILKVHLCSLRSKKLSYIL